MKNNYPINKLKILLEHDDANTNSAVIEKIVSHRKNPDTNLKEYLVKWEGFDEEDTEWLAEDAFDDFKIVKDYNDKLSKPVETTSPIEKPKRSRGRPRLQLLTPLHLIVFAMLCMLFCIDCEIVKIKNKFEYCDMSNAVMLDLEKNCLSRGQSEIWKSSLTCFPSYFKGSSL